ncbi:MAG: methionyl-tRNA formyltransferase [Nostoc sp. CmiVER01]|uniref:methionyl-tRNA formyltransferase n=1 Tax=Nostoc sp. CmiVER01 TaxID=3075384 RepID=UPI002AD54800|nr:methionyl-tRNA formyltransferase [Nostoc sp. CmiVER01]MDZ8123791.1 methionyl-tRNA formyltransferase [Nostoc sp. CmiVER01]
MKIVFLGNHTVGVKALETISKMADVVGVVSHPPDPEDGIRYLSVYDFAIQQGWTVIRSIGKNPSLENFIQNAQPDLLWVTDYRYLLPLSLLQLAPLGAVNLHPSLLPKYRGRAPLNWAILQGERELGLTAHFIDNGTDTGDIIEQIRFELSPTQDVGDALEIIYPIYQKLTRIVLKYFQTGKIPRKPQNHSQATIFPARKPQDGLINWQQTASSIHNLIRAVAKPYPGAFTYFGNWNITIWKACVESSFHKATPGQILSVSLDKQFCVACGEGILRVLDFTIEPQIEQGFSIYLGDILQKY